MNVDEMVMKCVGEYCKNKEIELDFSRNLDSQGINSFMFIQIVVNLEELFQVEFEDDYLSLSNFEKISDIANYIKQLLNNSGKEEIKNKLI